MVQTIFFERLSLLARIGTGEEERRAPQRLLSSGMIRLGGTLWRNDSITKTVDYDRLVHEIISASHHSEFCLLERLAEHIIDRLMELFPGISEVTVSLWKDPCPLPHSLDRVGVTLQLDRNDWEMNRITAKQTERNL